MSLMSWLKDLFSSQSESRPEAPLGRNDDCWCGSGKKYKRCHLKEDAEHRYEQAHAARVAATRKPPAGGGRPAPASGREATAPRGRR